MPSKTITITIPEEIVAKLTGLSDESLGAFIKVATKERLQQAIVERATAIARNEIKTMPEPEVTVGQ